MFWVYASLITYIIASEIVESNSKFKE